MVSPKKAVRKLVNLLGYDICTVNELAEGFPDFLKEARRLGVDVNDYVEQSLGWLPALPILEEVVFPILDSLNKPRVVELGVGTGRWSRHLVRKIEDRGGRLYLVDHSPWLAKYLKEFFRDEPSIEVCLSDGRSVPFDDAGSFDMVFSQGTFIELKLGRFFTYAREFSRILRDGGYCILDYIDIDTESGMRYLEEQSWDRGDCYTYHTKETVNRVFATAGFDLVNSFIIGKSTYAVYVKNERGGSRPTALQALPID